MERREDMQESMLAGQVQLQCSTFLCEQERGNNSRNFNYSECQAENVLLPFLALPHTTHLSAF